MVCLRRVSDEWMAEIDRSGLTNGKRFRAFAGFFQVINEFACGQAAFASRFEYPCNA